MVEGIWDCAFSQGSITWSRKLPLMHSHGETSDDFNLVSSGHFFEEKVVSKSDASAVIWVMIPRPSFAVKCVCTNCYLTGSSRRSKDNHAMIPFGSKTISKCCGSWEGQWEWRIWVSLSSVLSLFRERVLATLLMAIWEIVCLMYTGHFESNSGLDDVVIVLNEVWFPQPTFWGCAIGHPSLSHPAMIFISKISISVRGFEVFGQAEAPCSGCTLWGRPGINPTCRHVRVVDMLSGSGQILGGI